MICIVPSSFFNIRLTMPTDAVTQNMCPFIHHHVTPLTSMPNNDNNSNNNNHHHPLVLSCCSVVCRASGTSALVVLDAQYHQHCLVRIQHPLAIPMCPRHQTFTIHPPQNLFHHINLLPCPPALFDTRNLTHSEKVSAPSGYFPIVDGCHRRELIAHVFVGLENLDLDWTPSPRPALPSQLVS